MFREVHEFPCRAFTLMRRAGRKIFNTRPSFAYYATVQKGRGERTRGETIKLYEKEQNDTPHQPNRTSIPPKNQRAIPLLPGKSFKGNPSKGTRKETREGAPPSPTCRPAIPQRGAQSSLFKRVHQDAKSASKSEKYKVAQRLNATK